LYAALALKAFSFLSAGQMKERSHKGSAYRARLRCIAAPFMGDRILPFRALEEVRFLQMHLS
jgi:hypothetical protein